VGRDGFILGLETFFEIVDLKRKFWLYQQGAVVVLS